MAWQDTIVDVVRGLVSDMTPPYTYSNTRIEELIVISGILVSQDVDFNTSYTFNTKAVSITPDPETDMDFVSLVALKTACTILSGEHRTAANKAVSVKDGPAFIDTKDRAKHLGTIAATACANYVKAKFSYQMGDGSVGRSIVGPYNSGQSSETGRRFA